MDELIKYVIKHQDQRFSEIRGELQALSKQVSELREFRVQVSTSTRVTLIIVGAVSGIFGSLIVAYFPKIGT